MNWKQILLKGLPVLLIAAVIVIVAAIASRPKPQPKVTNAGEKVLDFNNLQVTKGELYDRMKTINGLNSLINIIDNNLLEEYEEKVDLEELDEEIEADKESDGENKFYQNMIIQGVISSKDDPDKEEKIRDFYMLNYLQEAYVKEITTNEYQDLREMTDEEAADLSEDEKTIKDSIESKIEDYRQDMCVILLNFNKLQDSNTFSNDIKAIEDNEDLDESAKNVLIKDLFNDEYEVQNPDDEDEEDEVENPPFMEDFTCDYERIQYDNNNLPKDILDDIYDDDFDEGDYNNTAKYITGKGYYFVYKVNQPFDDESYKETDSFVQYMIDSLVSDKLTDTYIRERLGELRETHELKIYDTDIGEQYQNITEDFEPEKKLLKKDNGEYVVASYKDNDGNTQYVHADDLYAFIEERSVVSYLLNMINYESLKTIPEIELSETKKEEIDEQVVSLKQQFLQQNYGITWQDFLLYQYNVFNEEQLFDMIAGSTLRQRYLLGYEDYEGVIQVDEAKVVETYNAWFEITASHILFSFEENDADSEALAIEKTEQVLYGCTDNGEFRGDITAETCYIHYDSEGETTDTETPFVGLDEIEHTEYGDVFGALAQEYSDDPSASQNKGDLGAFGPEDMVDPFEEKAKDIAFSGGSEVFGITDEPSEIERTDETIFGYHVIYVKDSKEYVKLTAEEKTRYDQYIEDLEDEDVSDDDIQDEYTDEEIEKFDQYKADYEKVEDELLNEINTTEMQNKYLAILRDDLGFAFIDQDLQEIYYNVNEYLKAYDPEDEEEDTEE